MAVITTSNPPTVRAPTGYTHGIVVEGAQRRLIISGQVGLTADGSVPNTGEGQIAQAFANLRAVLDANGMAVTNIVKTTVFLTRPCAAVGVPRGARRGVRRPCAGVHAAVRRGVGGSALHGGDRGRGGRLKAP